MINSDRMANLVLMSDAGYEQNCLEVTKWP